MASGFTPAHSSHKEPLWHFQCPKCDWTWSTLSWTSEQGKPCEDCGTMLYPLNEDYPAGKGLTPYQGLGRRFGEFKCPKCQHSWMSANTWADKGQECRDCKINVMPHKQSCLRVPVYNIFHIEKPGHPQELCEKCKELGKCCKEKFVVPPHVVEEQKKELNELCLLLKENYKKQELL